MAASNGPSKLEGLAGDVQAERIKQILSEPSRKHGLSPSRALAQLGPGSEAHLFDALVKGLSNNGGGHRPLDARQRVLVLDALELMPPGEVLGHLESFVVVPAELDELATALEVMGRVARVGDLALAFRLAEHGMLGDVLPHRLQDALGAALDLQLARQPEALGNLAVAGARRSTAVQAVVAQAIGRLESHAALLTLGDLLGRGSRLDMLVLADMERCATKSAMGVPPSTRDAVRDYLDALEPELLSQACRSVRALGDMQATARLIELLGHEDPTVRAAAHDALARLAGVDLGREASAWATWHEAEQAWWNDEAPDHLRALRSGSPWKRAQAVEELARGRLHRTELVPILVELLDDRQPGIPRLACVVLGHLEDKQAMPALNALLAGDDPKLADSARDAMRRIARGRSSREPKRRVGPPVLPRPARRSQIEVTR